MAEELAVGAGEQPAQQPEVVSQKALLEQLDKAVKSGDFKQIAKVASEIDKAQKATEKAELATKQVALQAITLKVASTIQKALKPLVDAKELDLADGVWFGYDFGAVVEAGINPYCRLIKTAGKPRTGGGGGGKKFDVSTTDLLAKYGGEPYKDTGLTFQQAHDQNQDKNWRYGIREALLKKHGLI